MAQVDSSRWICVYPSYIDGAKSLKDGRKIPKAQCCKNPSIVRIAHAVKALGVPFVLEPRKCFPSDCFNRGRLRVKLLEEDGSPTDERFTSRMELWKTIAHKVPEVEMKGDMSKREESKVKPDESTGKSSKRSKKKKRR